MNQISKGYIKYNGLTPMFSLATNWQPGTTVPLEDLSKSLGERCKDTECGDTFIRWISEFVSRTPSFSLHLAALAEADTSSRVEVVESQPITVAQTKEQAVQNLQSRELGAQSENRNASGIIEESDQERVKTSKMFTSVAEAKQQQSELKTQSEPMTGDMLDSINPYTRIGDVNVAQPTVDPTVAPLAGNVNTVETQQPNVVVANPAPTIDVKNDIHVSTGEQGILTTRPSTPAPVDPQIEAFANMKPVHPQTKLTSQDGTEATVVTGDDLQSPVTDVPGATAEHSSTPAATAKSVGGTRPTVQGTAGRRDITIDHIVRADSVQRSIDAVNECKDRQVLKLAKSQLGNTGDVASNKVIKVIDRRLRFLKSRGL